MSGSWSGKGTVKVRVNSLPMTVSCKFVGRHYGPFALARRQLYWFLGFSRAIGAVIKSNGSTYSGSYVGAGTGQQA